MQTFSNVSRPARGGPGGSKIPGAQSAQRSLVISVNVLIVYHPFMFVPKCAKDEGEPWGVCNNCHNGFKQCLFTMELEANLTS